MIKEPPGGWWALFLQALGERRSVKTMTGVNLSHVASCADPVPKVVNEPGRVFETTVKQAWEYSHWV